ncbi:MAG: PLDc_N domain-containing protein [Chloroflexales bacterium]|nr:PLDc_N domain-containing protein [Chloroflexales bacterium]
MPRKRWSELSPAQQRGIIGLACVQLSLLVAALWDIRQRPAEQINGSKGLWTALSFVSFIGPLAYFVFGRKRV